MKINILFMMEVLKVKFQKIKENKNQNLILPGMIWKEALRKIMKVIIGLNLSLMN